MMEYLDIVTQIKKDGKNPLYVISIDDDSEAERNYTFLIRG